MGRRNSYACISVSFWQSQINKWWLISLFILIPNPPPTKHTDVRIDASLQEDAGEKDEEEENEGEQQQPVISMNLALGPVDETLAAALEGDEGGEGGQQHAGPIQEVEEEEEGEEDGGNDGRTRTIVSLLREEKEARGKKEEKKKKEEEKDEEGKAKALKKKALIQELY